MEGERRVLPPIYDQLNISFSAPQEMGFLQFDEHHNFSCFLPPTASPEISQGGATVVKPTTTANNNGSLGFNHDQLLDNYRPSWNDDQVVET